MRILLSDGPLDGSSYKFEGRPNNKEITFRYGGKCLIYKYDADLIDGWLYKYAGESLWISTKL